MHKYRALLVWKLKSERIIEREKNVISTGLGYQLPYGKSEFLFFTYDVMFSLLFLFRRASRCHFLLLGQECCLASKD